MNWLIDDLAGALSGMLPCIRIKRCTIASFVPERAVPYGQRYRLLEERGFVDGQRL